MLLALSLSVRKGAEMDVLILTRETERAAFLASEVSQAGLTPVDGSPTVAANQDPAIWLEGGPFGLVMIDQFHLGEKECRTPIGLCASAQLPMVVVRQGGLLYLFRSYHISEISGRISVWGYFTSQRDIQAALRRIVLYYSSVKEWEGQWIP